MVLLLSAPWLARAQEKQASDKPQAAKTAQWTGSFDFKSGSNYQKGESINYRYSNAGGEIGAHLARKAQKLTISADLGYSAYRRVFIGRG